MKHLAALFILFFASGIEVFSMEKDTLASEDLKYPLLFEDEDPKAGMQYFKYDSITNDLKPLPIGFRPEKFTDAFSFDPVRFTISSNKETVTLGEEIEITITAEFLDVNPNLMFTLEGSNAYTLKMLMPKGFVQTGGDYYDFIKGEVDKSKRKEVFKINGFFEHFDQFEKLSFVLIRGWQDNNGLFRKVADLELIQEVLSTNAQLQNETKSRVGTTEASVCGQEFVTITVNPFEISTSSYTLCPNGSIDLSSSGCSGSILWSNGSTGATINTDNPGEYFARCTDICGNDSQRTSEKVYITKIGSPNTPVVSTDNVYVCGDEKSNLLAIGCDFTCEWSNGAEGNLISVGPGTYTVECVSVCETSSPSNPIVISIGGDCNNSTRKRSTQQPISEADNVESSSEVFSISEVSDSGSELLKANKQTINACEEVVLTLLNCNSTVKWCNGTEVLNETATSITVTPSETTTYNASCELNPEIIVGTDQLCVGKTTFLSSKNCISTPEYKFLDGATWEPVASVSAVGAGTYKVVCDSKESQTKTITSLSSPSAPSIQSDKLSACGDENIKLFTTDCVGLEVVWSREGDIGFKKTGQEIYVQTAGIYSAKCEKDCDGTVLSPKSNSITTSYSDNCSCGSAQLTGFPADGKVIQGSTLILTTTLIQGAVYTWDIPYSSNASYNTSGNVLTISNFSSSNVGPYEVTLNCNPTPLDVTLSMESVPPSCNFETSAWSNSQNGQVGVDGTIQLTANGGDSYQWWKHGSSGTFSSSERAPRISDVQVYDGGIYQVEISKTINGAVCKKVENVSVSISGCNLDAHAYFYESGNTFQLQAGGNFDHSQASVQWWKGNVFYGETWNITLDKNPLNIGTYYAKITKGTCSIDIPVEVDYVATPVYTGSSVHAVACQRIQAGILDQANAYKSVSFTAQVKIDDDVYNVPLRQNGDGTPAILYFNVPEKYKDGLEHDVIVKDPYGTPITNWAEESFMCCTLEFDNEPTVTCDDPVKSNFIEAAVTNMSPQGKDNMYFKVDQLTYDEDGELLTSIGNTWVASSGISAEFTDLDKGNYLISAREGSAGCEVSTIVPVYCGDENEDCTVPIISVFPGTDIKEGEGVYPVLYADVAHINASDNKEGLVLDGNSSISISTNTQLWGEFTVEALVNPEQGKTITIGDHSESSTQRYLFKSSYGGGGDFVAPQLSVGSNGINLIETGLNHSRLVLSYPTKLVGWNHIAVTYEDNKARLLINGVMVKSSDTKPPFNRSVVGPDHIGTDLNRGFVGSVYSFRIWRESMSDQQVAQLKNNFSPSLAADPSTGFWLFDKSPVNGIIEDLSVNGRDGKVEGLAYVLEPSEPINSPTAPVVSWWLDGIQVGTGPVYNVPPNKVQAGDLNYTAKYQNIDGSYCEADVTITVNPINFGSLSGCYLVKPVAHDHSMAPFQDATNKFRINVANYSEFPEKKIWKFAHLGNEDYRITSTFYDKSLDNKAGELTLSDTRTSALSQKWNAVPIDGNNLIYKFESLSSSANYLKFGYFDTDYFTISGGSEASKSFKLLPTACPLPPAECDVNGQITFERFMQESLINYWYNEFQALDVPTFITQNEDYPPIYVHTGDIGDISISRNIYTQMHAITPRILPAAWASHSTQDQDLWVGRMSGYFCPPENGDFTFYIKSDEWSEIWISTDEDPSHKVRVAYNHSYSGDWTTNYTQKSDFITLTKGRMYYVEVIFKDQANTFFVDVAYQKGGGPIQNLTTEHFSSTPRDIPPGIFSVSANKTSAAPTESVTLTANGCYYGRVVWRVGATVIQDENASIPTITEIGPGTYQAICTGDPSVIQEWVTIYIEPTTAVVPIPSGPNYACDGQTITLTASGAPTGYTYKWYVLKDEAAKKFFRENIAVFDLFDTNPELFNTYTTTTASVTGPGDYYLQTISGNGAYKSEIRKITIAPAFPDDLEASNNSPIEIDGVLTLAVGYAPAGTTYSWTGPAGFSSTGRNVARANFSEAMAGVYTVTIATGSTCSFTSTTEVSVANCDIYIQSKDASDQETYTLERTPGVAGSFEPLTLSILPYTGTNTFDAYKVVWYYNGDPIEPAPTTKTIQVSKAGDYRAVLSLKLNPSTICETEVHIAGKPCNPPINSGVCGSVTVVPVPDGLSEGVQLAPGDEFTAGDYTVIVTEITSGSKAGWWGKGYVAMRLINDINAAKISVTFEDAVINECYELAAGRVLTEYDPNWGGVLDVDETIEDVEELVTDIKESYNSIKNKITDLIDRLSNLNCNSDTESIQSTLNELNEEKNQLLDNSLFTPFEVSTIEASFTDLSSGATCMLDACSNPSSRLGNNANSRIVTNTCSINDLIDKGNKLDTDLEDAITLKEKQNKVVAKKPSGEYFEVKYKYFLNHNTEARTYFNSIASSLNGAPLGMQVGEGKYYWNNSNNKYTALSSWNSSQMPVWGTETLEFEMADEYVYYLTYVYADNGDCFFEKRGKVDNLVVTTTAFPGCVYDSQNGTNIPEEVSTTCPELPTVINANALIEVDLHWISNMSCLSELSFVQRKSLLREIFSNTDFVTSCLVVGHEDPLFTIGNCYEGLVRNILISTNPSDRKELLDFLKNENLLGKIYDGLQMDSFDTVLGILSKWIRQFYPPSGNIENYGVISSNGGVFNIDRSKSKILTFENNAVSARHSNGSYSFSFDINYEYSLTTTFNDPYEYVLVYFLTGIPGGEFTEKTYTLMPVLQAALIFNDAHRTQLINTSKVVLDIAMVVVGVGEVQAGLRAWQAGKSVYSAYLIGKSLLDLGLGVTDVVIQNTLADDWKANDPEKLEYWNRVNLLFSLGSLSESVIRSTFIAHGVGDVLEVGDDQAAIQRAFDDLLDLGGDDFVRLLETNSFTNLLEDYANLGTEELKIAFKADFESGSMLEKFNSGELKVKSWENLLNKNLSPAFRSDLTNLKQRSVIDEYSDIIGSSSNKFKGNFGELGADLDLNSKGYEPLLTRIDDIDAAGHNGIDGVFQKNGEYFIVEGKYTGTASLNSANLSTNLPRQMSDAWIQQKLPDAVSQNLADDIIDAGYSRILAKVAPDGTVTYKYVSDTGYLSQGGGPLGDWIP